ASFTSPVVGEVSRTSAPPVPLRASVRRHRCAQGGSPMLRSIRPKRARGCICRLRYPAEIVPAARRGSCRRAGDQSGACAPLAVDRIDAFATLPPFLDGGLVPLGLLSRPSRRLMRSLRLSSLAWRSTAAAHRAISPRAGPQEMEVIQRPQRTLFV